LVCTIPSNFIGIVDNVPEYPYFPISMQNHNTSITLTREEISLGEKLENLPTKPGVYQFKDGTGRVLYVGKAASLRNRVRQYFQKGHPADPRIDAMISKVLDVEVIVTDSEVEALILESNLIKKLKPRYNVNLKDDKSYPYIVVTNEPYPRVFVTRRIVRDGSRYFGPYTDVKTVRASLKMIRDIFKVRSCNYFIDDEVIKKRKIRVCLDYHIKKCDGPCEGLASQVQYTQMIKEVEQVLRGKVDSLIQSLEEQMQKASQELRFEEAAIVRDKIQSLRVYTERQKVVDLELLDRDLFAVAVEGNDACGVVFRVREGKIIGKRHVYLTGVEDNPGTVVVEQFVQRYYLDTDDIPREVYLPVEIPEPAAIEQWLTEKRKEKVQIVVPRIGEKAKLMTMCAANAKFLLEELKLQKMKKEDFVPHSVKALQRDLRLPNLPRRIECFDISNIQGSDSVASMVVFEDGKPKKSEYRKYKVRTVAGPDDFASMREVIERRYTRLLEEQGELPDLIVVDGGEGQLSSAVEVLERVGLRERTYHLQRTEVRSTKDLPVIGLAKRLEEVFVPEASDPQSIPKTSSGLKLLQQIRDEAHRFAVAYHRTLRKKRTLQTELDLIKGIGKVRARELLEAFGSVQGVKFATEEQLAEIVGSKIATKVKEYFADELTEETAVQ
jgi:excinuclease ABC subunit C